MALKLLSGRRNPVDREVLRFVREAQAGGRLRHPNVVTVHGYGELHGCHFIVQELVPDGSSLADFIESMRAAPDFPPDYDRRVARLVSKAARALQAAHDVGVIHRDVKPQNILIDEDDEPKVADFGLARLLDAESISHTGEFAGTYCYMSPEQAMSRRMGIDHRTDVFSLGATLYELITLHRAFDGETTHEVAEMILYVDPPAPRTVRPEIPRDLEVVCRKAMEKRRDHRYADMAALADDLDRFLAGEPIRARPAGPWVRFQKLVRRRPTGSAAIGVAVLALLVLLPLGWQGLRSREAVAAARYEALHMQLLYAIEVGDLEEAEELLAQAEAIDDRAIEGHLNLAMAYAERDEVPGSLRHLEEARRRGLLEDPAELETAMDHYAYGILLVAGGDPRRLREAVEHLERARDLDPDLLGIERQLYLAYAGLEEPRAAAAVLRDYETRIPSSEPRHALTRALRLEQEGEYEQALRELARIPPGLARGAAPRAHGRTAAPPARGLGRRGGRLRPGGGREPPRLQLDLVPGPDPGEALPDGRTGRPSRSSRRRSGWPRRRSPAGPTRRRRGACSPTWPSDASGGWSRSPSLARRPSGARRRRGSTSCARASSARRSSPISSSGSCAPTRPGWSTTSPRPPTSGGGRKRRWPASRTSWRRRRRAPTPGRSARRRASGSSGSPRSWATRTGRARCAPRSRPGWRAASR